MRRLLGQLFVLNDNRIYEKSLKMPSNTKYEREIIFCYRRRGIREDVYKSILEKSKSYALKRSKNDISLYDYHFGLSLRWRVFVYKIKDVSSFLVSPYKYGCKF